MQLVRAQVRSGDAAPSAIESRRNCRSQSEAIPHKARSVSATSFMSAVHFNHSGQQHHSLSSTDKTTLRAPSSYPLSNYQLAFVPPCPSSTVPHDPAGPS